MKKGFTLIELLAVIVILAIIALIAIPTISGLIEKARLGAVRDSVYNMIDAAELHYAMNDSDSVNGSLTFTCDGSKCTTSSGQVLKFKGKVPSVGEISASKDNSNVFNLTIGNYCAIGSKNDLTVVKGDCAGLYDSNNKRIATWEELEKNYHVNVEYDYDFSKMLSYKDDSHNEYKYNSQYATTGYENLSYVLATEPKFENVTKIILPKTIKKIGNYALVSLGHPIHLGCGQVPGSKVEYVVIPNSVKSIGDYALSRNDGLKELIIPDSVDSIGDYAFSGLNSIEKIYIPFVNNVGEHIFNPPEFNEGTNYIKYDLREVYTGIDLDTLGLLYTIYPSKKLKKLSFLDNYGDVELDFPYLNLKEISVYSGKISGAFNVETLNIGPKVTEIGSYAFISSNNLKNVFIPSSVKMIGMRAFNSLNDMKFEDQNNWYFCDDIEGTSCVETDVSDSKQNALYYSPSNPNSGKYLIKKD